MYAKETHLKDEGKQSHIDIWKLKCKVKDKEVIIKAVRAPAPSIQYHASNLDWQFISHMVLYMFQCHPPKSSHPCPLAQSPKDCSMHLCLFCCLAYRIIITRVFLFLNVHIKCYKFPFQYCFGCVPPILKQLALHIHCYHIHRFNQPWIQPTMNSTHHR